jgi:hypothetical protein
MPPQPEDDEDVEEFEPGFNVNMLKQLGAGRCVAAVCFLALIC